MKVITRILVILSLLVPTLNMDKLTVSADGNESVEVILHKIVFPEGELPEASVNSGTTDGHHAELLKDYQGLNGVTFTVYDVTKDFYGLRQENPDMKNEEIQQLLVGKELTGEKPVAEETTATSGTDEGIARFQLASRSYNQDAVYLFRETHALTSIKALAEDMIVTLPVYDANEERLETIHLYPKNEQKELAELALQKGIVDASASYQYGDRIQYQLTVQLTPDLTKYKKFLLRDTFDEGLVLDKDSLVVKVGKEKLTDYQANVTEQGFTLDFEIAKLQKYAGETLVLRYTMTLLSKDKVDQALKNIATLETDVDKITDSKEVYTGGRRFIKVDLSDEKKRLTGAEFLVKDTQGNYLHETSAGYSWQESKENAKQLVSDNLGDFAVSGLRYGKYFLEEITAPAGYAVNRETIPFVVEKNSYQNKELALLVVNKKLPIQIINPPTSDKGSPSYPKTNESKSNWLMIVGLLLSVVVVVFRRKIKE